MCKALKRKQIDTDKYEIMNRKRREGYSSMTGTTEPEKYKQLMRKINQDRRTKIDGTPEHEKCKQHMRKTYIFLHKTRMSDCLFLHLPTLYIDTYEVKRVYFIKFLWVILDENLKRKTHIDPI